MNHELAPRLLFSAFRSPEDDPCHEVVTKILEVMSGIGRDKDGVANMTGGALTFHKQLAAASDNKIHFVLGMGTLEILTFWRKNSG